MDLVQFCVSMLSLVQSSLASVLVPQSSITQSSITQYSVPQCSVPQCSGHPLPLLMHTCSKKGGGGRQERSLLLAECDYYCCMAGQGEKGPYPYSPLRPSSFLSSGKKHLRNSECKIQRRSIIVVSTSLWNCLLFYPETFHASFDLRKHSKSLPPHGWPPTRDGMECPRPSFSSSIYVLRSCDVECPGGSRGMNMTRPKENFLSK